MSELCSATEDLLFSVDDGVAVMSLNRPDRMNAVNSDIRENLVSLLAGCEKSNAVRAVVLTGQGGRALSSGQDLNELAALDSDGVVMWQANQKRLLNAFRTFSKPIVTAVEGVCVGLGFHMSLCTDWRVAPENSTWGQPEVKVGLASIVGPHLIGAHVGNTHNAQLSLMAELINGKRAYEIGLLTEICDSGTALATGMARARKLAALPPTAVRLTKQRFCKLTQDDFDEAFAAGASAQLVCFDSGEPQRMISSFLSKRT